MAIRDQTHKFERLSSAVDQGNRAVVVFWMDRCSSGSLSLTAEEAIAIGQNGQMLKAAIDALEDAKAKGRTIRVQPEIEV